MSDLDMVLSPETLQVSVKAVENVLAAAALKEAVVKNFVVVGAGFSVTRWPTGFSVGTLNLPEVGYESIIVEYKPERSWTPVGPAHDAKVWERSIEVEAEMLSRYQIVLEAAGLKVTRLNRTPNGRQAWLSIR